MDTSPKSEAETRDQGGGDERGRSPRQDQHAKLSRLYPITVLKVVVNILNGLSLLIECRKYEVHR